MKIPLLRIGKFYIRFDIPLVVTELLFGFATMAGMYSVCTDTTFTDCKVYKFSETQFGFLIFNLCIGLDEEVDQNQFDNFNSLM